MKRMLPKYAGGKPDIIDDETLDFIIQHEGFKPDTMGKDLVTGAPWIGSGIEVQKYLDQFNKTGKWSAEDNKKAIREILQGYTPHLRKTFGNAWDTLNREQKRVLYDIAYNIGVGNLTAEKSPNFVKAVISGDTDRAKKEMNWGNHQARGLAIRNAHRQALWGNSQVVKNDKGKVMTFGKDFWKVAPKQSYKSLWEPEQPINTVYPVSGKTETPESLSSWKGADAPNAAPRLKDF